MTLAKYCSIEAPRPRIGQGGYLLKGSASWFLSSLVNVIKATQRMVSASTRIRTAEDTEDPPLARRLGTFTETLHYFRCGGVVKRFPRCWQNFLVILPSRGNRGIDPGNQDLYRKDSAETEIRTLTA